MGARALWEVCLWEARPRAEWRMSDGMISPPPFAAGRGSHKHKAPPKLWERRPRREYPQQPNNASERRQACRLHYPIYPVATDIMIGKGLIGQTVFNAIGVTP